MGELLMMTDCKEDNCNAKHKALGLCAKHYRRLQRHGTTCDPLVLSIKDRLSSLSKVNELTGCIEWVASLSKDGYGKMDIHRRTMRSHIVSYREHKGEFPEGMQVLHTCANRKCINPEHLYIGTHKQNMKDMIRDGNYAYGSRHGRAKIKEADVHEIHLSASKGITRKSLAHKFDLSVTVVGHILTGKLWKHVEVSL